MEWSRNTVIRYDNKLIPTKISSASVKGIDKCNFLCYNCP